MPWGGTDTITARVSEHLRAGADHVALTVLDNDDQPAIDSARQLARGLLT